MNPNMYSPIQLTVASSVLTADGTGVAVSFNPPPGVTFTQAQLTAQLAQLQTQAANLTAQMNNNATQQANVQAQLALFPVQAQPPAS
jgi:uncharacterized phage infection (PIP) family protein YhgE